MFHTGFEIIDHAIPQGVDQKLDNLLAKLREQFQRKVDEVENDAQSNFRTIESLSALRNMADSSPPATVIQACERIVSENNHCISTLLGHAVEMMMVVEEVKKVALSARQRAEDNVSKIDGAFVDFTNILIADGIVARDIIYVTKKQRQEILSILKKEEFSDQDVDFKDIPKRTQILDRIREAGANGILQNYELSSDKISQNYELYQSDGKSTTYAETPSSSAKLGSISAGNGLSGGVISDSESGVSPGIPDSKTPALQRDEAVKTGCDSDVIGIPKSPSDSGMLDLNLPAESHKGSQILQPAKPVPSVVLPRVSRWSDINLNPFGYMYLETTASTDIDMEALKITLPEHDSLYDYALPNSQEYIFAKSAYENGSMEDFAGFLRLYEARTNHRMSEMERRIWALLLLDYKRGPDLPLVGKGGFYHGIVLATRPGTTRVSRVEIISDKPEDMINAFRKR
ncbi:MAG: hypothetical protein MK060_18670 [Blastomonas sp.]|uniref:hypothetical protein n=1 Tax=Blastomonas sp. TaxID=1909299 RepID=UPI0010F6A4EC|nr:hypothetical protein [Blastomonas sp.]